MATDTAPPPRPALVFRNPLSVRLAHWSWALCIFFLVVSGLQIFNAHPTLYIGHQSGQAFDNSVLSIGATASPDGPKGVATVNGRTFDTTGWLGVTGPADNPSLRAFPPSVTLPSYQSLATGRLIHFAFAWLFVGTLFYWLLMGLIGGHLWRNILPGPRTLIGLPRDIWHHLTFRFHSEKPTYAPLQRIAYFIVLFGLFPLMVLTGLAMSPAMNAAWPGLTELFGGRQTARTLHFVGMIGILGFFVIHLAMVLLAGPFNEMRSIITGWWRPAAPRPPRQPRPRRPKPAPPPEPEPVALREGETA